MVTIVILTKNEEKDLSACLQAINWSDDIYVLDSGSTDKTVEIAQSHGANVIVNPFVSFGQQRNFALDNISGKYDWILFLDADEVATERFKEAVLSATRGAGEDIAGYYCCWKMMLDNVWLKHCDNFPKWQFRLMKKGKARFTDFGHGQKEAEIVGTIAYLKEPYLHYGFSKGWSQWIERHNKYSSQEAKERYTNCPPLGNILSKHGSVRNPALKSWLSRLPGWPMLRFLQAYLFNLGFLEGVPGFIYCANMAYYEFLIQIKIRELKSNAVK